LLGERDISQSTPIHLSSAELQGFLAQIDNYFQVEYQILLRQVGELTALSIVYAGDLAPERLYELKKLGFQGLGRIEPVNFDRILWLFLTISIGGFCIFYLLRYNQLRVLPDANARGLLTSFAVFSFTMAFAALVGAGYGSNKKYVHAQHTPWGAYFTGGAISVAMFVAAHAARLLFTPPEYQGYNPGQVLPLSNQIPWVLIPFVLTVGICRLARMNRWPIPRAWLSATTVVAILERALDGLTLALLMLAAYSAAIIFHDVFDIPLPIALRDAPYKAAVYLPSMLFGFLIGIVAVRDARRAGQASILDRAARDEPSLDAVPTRSTLPAGRSLAGQPAE
jgi:hypothetical protein